MIPTQFRMQLSRALAEAANSFDIVGSDHRIGPLLKVKFCCVASHVDDVI